MNWHQYGKSESIDWEKQGVEQIKQLFLEIVGEDELSGKKKLSELSRGASYKDELRAELRKKVESL